MAINTLGRYKIVREIARSNDVVYEAIDTGINRRIALKELLLPPNLSSAQKKERIERFYREARAAGLLSHPNIVTIFEVGEDNGRHFIAMEYLEGRTLREVLEKEGKLPPDQTVKIVEQVCEALGYAHAHNVVHRDVKPDNIQILPTGHVKLTDFGIARIMEEPTLTADGQVFGTPSYMSPEQVAGKHLDQRTDLFSLGIVLYEMLTGSKPFTGDTVVTITYNIMNQDLNIPPSIPPYLDRVLRRALEKDPDRRYASAAEMEKDLDPNNAPYLPFGPAQPSLNTTIQSPGPILGPPSMPPPPQFQPPVDPFRNLRPGALSMPQVPSKPILSEATAYFLKVFLAVIAVCGIVIFFVWALTTAYQNVQETAGSDVVVGHMNSGKDYYNQQSYQSALDQYQIALTLSHDPKQQSEIKHDMAVCFIAAGDQYETQGDVNSAIEEWKKALECESRNPDALDRIASVYLSYGDQAASSGDNKAAQQYWQQAEQAGPGTPSGLEAATRLQQSAGSGGGEGGSEGD